MDELSEVDRKPVPHKNTGWRLFLQTILARAYPRVIGQQRETSWLIFEIIMPLGAVIGYVLVYKALKAPEDYIGFVVMGGAMLAFWMNVLWSMSSAALLGKGTGQPGSLHHGSQFDDGRPAGNGPGGIGGDDPAIRGDHPVGLVNVQCAIHIGQSAAIIRRLLPVDDIPVWDGNDAWVGLPALWAGGLGDLGPGAGTG